MDLSESRPHSLQQEMAWALDFADIRPAGRKSQESRDARQRRSAHVHADNLLIDETLSDHTDAHLIERLRSGDRAAWDSLFTSYGESVWRYVAKLLGSDSAAVADVVQETFQAIIQSIAQFDHARGSLWSWITGIAHNRAMLHWRSRRRDRGLSLESLIAENNGRLSRWFDRIESPSASLVQEESAELVRQVLAELPADYSYCLIAKYVEDRSAAEIAESLGESIDAIRSRLTRARGAFREKLHWAGAEDLPWDKSLKGTRS